MKMFNQQSIRKIIHVDMDAFYASIEQRDFPELLGKPVVVGGQPNSRGVVATASYEARQFGIKSAMPCSQAYKLCPSALFVPPRFDVYKTVSKQIQEIFLRYTDLVEPLSLDEAYLDVTYDKKEIGSALEIAKEIKASIREELQLTASAGISVNKFVAKIASALQKPDGLTFIGPSKVEAFMDQLSIDKFFGIGKVTAQKMQDLGIFNGADLRNISEATLKYHLGKRGSFFYHVIRGIDLREVNPERAHQSIGVEGTFRTDVDDSTLLLAKLSDLSKILSQRAHKNQLKGSTITLKIKFDNFDQITRSHTTNKPLCDVVEIRDIANKLLIKSPLEGKKIRLLGVSLSNFKSEKHWNQLLNNSQLLLFE